MDNSMTRRDLLKAGAFMGMQLWSQHGRLLNADYYGCRS